MQQEKENGIIRIYFGADLYNCASPAPLDICLGLTPKILFVKIFESFFSRTHNFFCKSIWKSRSCLKIGRWSCIRKWLGVLNFSTVLVNCSIRWKLYAFYDSNNSYFCTFSNVFVCFFSLFFDIKVRIKIEICNILIATIAKSVRDWINNTSVSRESIDPF